MALLFLTPVAECVCIAAPGHDLGRVPDDRWRYVSKTLQEEPAAPERTRIQLCGRLSVQIDGVELVGALRGRQVPMLLSYLVLGRWFSTLGIAMLGLQYVASGVYSPLSKELLNREIIDSSRRATILSLESMSRRLAFGLFAPLVGLTIDRLGLSAGTASCSDTSSGKSSG